MILFNKHNLAVQYRCVLVCCVSLSHSSLESRLLKTIAFCKQTGNDHISPLKVANSVPKMIFLFNKDGGTYDVFSILPFCRVSWKNLPILYQVSLIEHVQQLAIAPVHRAPAAAPHEEEPNLSAKRRFGERMARCWPGRLFGRVSCWPSLKKC